MRNVIVHQYFGILPDVVWDVVRNELPGPASGGEKRQRIDAAQGA